MMKTLLVVPLVLGTLSLTAQSGGNGHRRDFKNQSKREVVSGSFTSTHHGAPAASLRILPFWSEDFSGGSVPTGWNNTDDLTPIGTQNVTFQWSSDPAVVGPFALGYVPSSVFGSTDANNGFLWANSDRGLTAAPGTDHLTRLTTTAIDCSGQPTVLLTMQSLVGVFDYDANTNVRVNVSTDGTTWTTFVPFPCLVTGTSAPPCTRWSANPQNCAVDISSAAANQAQVFVRFEWLGGWDYFWAIDDLALSPVPDFELAMDFGVLSHTGTGEEYGRVPSGQLLPTFGLGSQVYNAGINDQTNVVLNADVRNASNTSVFAATSNLGTLASGDTSSMDETVSISALPQGVYTTAFTVTSDQIGQDSESANDTILRAFEVNDLLYSLDGIGVHLGTPSTSALGTTTFTTSADGAYFLTYYPVQQDLSVYAIDILLAPGTLAGGLVIASIHDSTSILTDEDLGSPLIESLDYIITAADVTAGAARIPLYGGILLPAEGYYAAVQLFSNLGVNDVLIVDDNTVPQPSQSSMIYLPGETDPGPYTNGNALGIRMVLDPAASINEQELAGVSMFPNPTDGQVQVVLSSTPAATYTVLNTLGELVQTGRFAGRTTIDLTTLPAGVYSIRISDENSSTTQLVARY